MFLASQNSHQVPPSPRSRSLARSRSLSLSLFQAQAYTHTHTHCTLHQDTCPVLKLESHSRLSLNVCSADKTTKKKRKTLNQRTQTSIRSHNERGYSITTNQSTHTDACTCHIKIQIHTITKYLREAANVYGIVNTEEAGNVT